MMPSARFPDLEGASVLITGGGIGHRRGADGRLRAAGREGRLHRHRRGAEPARCAIGSARDAAHAPLFLEGRPARHRGAARGGRAGRSRARAGHRADQQRRLRRAPRHRRGDASTTGTTTRRSTSGRISSPRRRCADGMKARRQRLDHQLHLDLVPDQSSRHAVLHGRQGRHHRPDQGACRPARTARHPRQRGRARLGHHRAPARSSG